MADEYTQNKAASRSVYSVAATDGVWVGLLMGACAACMIMASANILLAWISMVLFIVTPFVVWRMLREGWVTAAVPATFSAVWLHGICIFLFGGLLMALTMYLTLRFVTPQWIETQTLLAAERLMADPQTVAQGRSLVRIVETGQLPSPIYTAVSSIWLVSFTGSLLSMMFALILTRTRHFIALRTETIDKYLHDGYRSDN